jgi:FMN phosphatase YigB (HAD superfamily)
MTDTEEEQRLLQRVHEPLADTLLAMAEALEHLRPHRRDDTMQIVRLLTQAQQRLTVLTSGPRPAAPPVGAG